MENESARRGKTFLKIIGILLAIGAVCFVVAKLYSEYDLTIDNSNASIPNSLAFSKNLLYFII